jgi:hypothetical protein
MDKVGTLVWEYEESFQGIRMFRNEYCSVIGGRNQNRLSANLASDTQQISHGLLRKVTDVAYEFLPAISRE